MHGGERLAEPASRQELATGQWVCLREDHQIDISKQIQMREAVVEKELVVGGRWGATSTLRTGKSLVDKLLYPGEAPIGSSHSIESVEVIYPPLSIRAFGWNINWMVMFFILSLVFGYAFKSVIGVEI